MLITTSVISFGSTPDIRNSRNVRIGIYENKPKVFTDEKGNASGIFVAIFSEIAKRENWTVSYVPCRWAECLKGLQNGSIDIMPDVGYSLERDSILDFPHEYVIESWSQLYMQPGNQISKWSDLHKKKVVILKGSIQKEFLEQMMQGLGYKISFIEAESYNDAFRLVNKNMASGVVANHFYGDYVYREYGLEKAPVVFNPVLLYFATAAGKNQELLDGIDRQLVQLKKESGSVFYRELSRWMEQPATAILPPYAPWIAGGIFSALVFALLLVLLLRRQVNAKTQNLMELNEALRKSEVRLQNLVNSQTHYVLRIDLNGIFLYYNTNFATDFGWIYSQNGIDHDSLLRSVCDYHSERAKDAIANCIAKTGRVVKVELDKPGMDNKIKTILWEFVCLTDSKGGPFEIQCMGVDISDRKAMELHLVQSEEKYRSLFENSPDGYLIIQDGKYVECNRASEKMIGGDRSLIIGRSPKDIAPKFQPNGRLSSEYADELIETAFRTGSASFEWEHVGFDGSIFLSQVNLAVVYFVGKKSIFSVWQDITKKKRDESQLRKLSLVVKQSPISIIITDTSGVIEYANPMACRITGYSYQELVGCKSSILKSGETSVDEYRQLWNQITHGNDWKGVFHNKRKNGELFWESATISPITDENGAITNYAAIKEDITERKSIQEALELSEKRISQATENSRTVVWEINDRGLFTYVSAVSKSLYGYSPEELIGKMNFFDLHPLEGREEYKLMGLEYLTKGVPIVNNDTPILCKNEEIVWVSSNGEPIFGANDTVIGFRGTDHDITERKINENELKKFRTISDQSNSGNVLASLDGDILYANESFARMFGWNVKDLIGNNLRILYNKEQLNRITEMHTILKVHGEYNAEVIWCQKKDGTVFPALMNGKLILNDERKPQFVSETAIDISEIKQKEAEIKKLKTAIEQSPVAIVVARLDGLITYVSPAFSSITGYSSEDVLDMNDSMLKFVLGDASIYKELSDTIAEGKIWYGELLNAKKNGESYRESITVSPVVDEQGLVNSFLAVIADVTDHKRAEEELIARKTAEEANKAKSTFLSNMSHEIRTPLNAIIGFSQILQKDGALTPEQLDEIQIISRSGDHLLKLINDILDLSKIEAGRVSPNISDFSLHGLIDDLESMFSLQTSAKGIQLIFERQENVPAYVCSDEEKIRQIMINLIGNSIKFTKVGCISVRFQAEQRTNDHLLLVEVEDTGPGIPENDIGHIFDSFRQAEAGRQAGGTGLGLTISKNLIELVGGKIDVESKLGVGTLFRFQIPMQESHQILHENHPVVRQTVIGFHSDSGPIRILIVDDVTENRALLRAMLTPIGFEMKEAQNGKEALDIITQWQPHAVLMDLRMPIMDGYEATLRIKTIPDAQRPRTIAVTASAFKDDEKSVRDSGFDGYIRKPFRLEELLDVLQKNLDLQYIFAASEENALKSSDKAPLNRDQMNEIPVKLREDLCLCVERGDMSVFNELLIQVAERNSMVAEKMRGLAKQYDYEQLIALLSPIRKGNLS